MRATITLRRGKLRIGMSLLRAMTRSLGLLLRDRQRLHGRLPDFVVGRDLAEDCWIKARAHVWNNMLPTRPEVSRRTGDRRLSLDMN